MKTQEVTLLDVSVYEQLDDFNDIVLPQEALNQSVSPYASNAVLAQAFR